MTEADITADPQQPIPETKDAVEEAGVKVKVGDARAAAQLIPVGARGYITPQDFAQMADIAKAMANSKEAVPIHVRGNLGMSIALHDMAMAWGFSPYMLANESSVIKERLGFTSHVFRAVMDKRAGLRGRLKVSYDGTGDDRTCTVTGHFKNELDPLSYTTPPIKKIKPGRNDKGELRGSPLWDTDPDRQQFYYASRAFCRMYCPEVMLGLFGIDELQDMVAGVGAEHAIDVTSNADALTARLKAAQMPTEGFSKEHIEAALNHKPQLRKRLPKKELAKVRGVLKKAKR
jgi:hypothetical protein